MIVTTPAADDGQEAAALQPFGAKRHAQSIVPKNLDQLAAFAAEHIEVATVRVSLEGFLHQQILADSILARDDGFFFFVRVTAEG